MTDCRSLVVIHDNLSPADISCDTDGRKRFSWCFYKPGWWFQINFIFLYFHRYLGKIPILTHIFQMGWFNHQLETIWVERPGCWFNNRTWFPKFLQEPRKRRRRSPETEWPRFSKDEEFMGEGNPWGNSVNLWKFGEISECYLAVVFLKMEILFYYLTISTHFVDNFRLELPLQVQQQFWLWLFKRPETQYN